MSTGGDGALARGENGLRDCIRRIQFSIQSKPRRDGRPTTRSLGKGSPLGAGGALREVVSIKLPYACKLLFQELLSMNIVPRLTLQAL